MYSPFTHISNSLTLHLPALPAPVHQSVLSISVKLLFVVLFFVLSL